jgi:putative peptidoglycan lipid II flippase
MAKILSASGAAGTATLLSRILGFVRESAYAAFMGTGPVADAFFLAFQIPSLFRRLLGEGALSTAFIPVFKETERKEGEAAAMRVGLAFFWAVLMTSAAVCVVAAIILTVLIEASNVDYYTELMFRLMRIMLPYLPMVCVAAGFIGMLNSRRRFFLPALGAAMLNVVMLLAIWLLAPRFGTQLHQQVFGLAVGIVIAGVAQAAFQIPALRAEGFHFRWLNPWREPAVRTIARRMGPTVLGVAAFQINTVLCQSFAYSHGREIVSSFNYAVRLMELPQGVVGVSLATVLLPELSALAADKKFPEFRSTLSEGLRQMVFLTLLPLVLLLTLAEPMVRLLFERGAFDAGSTGRVSLMLTCLTPGLMAFSLNNLLARAFYAMGDTKTPMRISLAAIAVNLVAAFVSISIYPRAGLAFANSASSIVNCVLLVYAVKRSQPKFSLRAFQAPVLRMLAAGLGAGVVAVAARLAWGRFIGHDTLPARFGEVFVPIAFATLAYGGIALALRVNEVHDVLGVLRRKRNKTAVETAAPATGDSGS